MRRLLMASIALMLVFAAAVAQGEPGSEWDYGPPPFDPHDKKWHGKAPFHWYPMECCSASDCAPADTITRVEEWKGRWITSKHGRVWVPDKKKSFTAKDKMGKEVDFEIPAFEKVRTHVCMRKPYSSDPKPAHGDMHVICIFQETGL